LEFVEQKINYFTDFHIMTALLFQWAVKVLAISDKYFWTYIVKQQDEQSNTVGLGQIFKCFEG